MSSSRPPSRLRNLTLAGIAAQAGCWIVIVVFTALFAGLWLDAQFGQRGPFTVGLVLLSIPVTLFVVFRIVMRLIGAIQYAPPDDEHPGAPSTGG